MIQKTRSANLVPQKLGWLDRIIRFIIGTALIASPVTFLTLSPETPTWLSDGVPMAWPYYVILIAIFPLLTAILGCNPLFALISIRSCGTSAHNPCSTFPFELEVAAGSNPRLLNDVDQGLSNPQIGSPTESTPRRCLLHTLIAKIFVAREHLPNEEV